MSAVRRNALPTKGGLRTWVLLQVLVDVWVMCMDGLCGCVVMNKWVVWMDGWCGWMGGAWMGCMHVWVVCAWMGCMHVWVVCGWMGGVWMGCSVIESNI